jgi:hypothetical protein
MGVDVDLNPGDPIMAPGNSRVLGILPGWYRGQPYVALQLLDGPMRGRNYYVAEQIELAVTPGQVVERGQPIGHYAASGTGIEMGWAGPDWQQTLAQAEGNTGDASHNDAPAGISFRNFLNSLAHRGSEPVGSGGSGGSSAEVAADVMPASETPGGSPAGVSADLAPGPAAPGPAAEPSPTAGSASAQAAYPKTATFKAVETRGRAGPRATVQFLSTVQPPPGSPLYDQDVAAAGTHPDAHIAVSPADRQPPRLGQDPGIAAESPGISSEGPRGAMAVRSSLLTSGQQVFAARLAQLTGLDPRVISAWELAEESGGYAHAREVEANFNWLNIGYFDSGAGAIAFDKAFTDPTTAAEQTANFLKGNWGGASSGIRGILDSVGQSPQAQMMAIANSGWASSGYNHGANLLATYRELADIQILAVT